MLSFYRQIIVYLALLLFAKCLCGTEPDQSTPQKAWESIQIAQASGDDATVFRLMTPTKQREVLARTLMGTIFWAGRTQVCTGDQEATSPMDKPQRELLQVLQDHGIDAMKTIEDFDEWHRNENREICEWESGAFLLARFQGDPALFYVNVNKRMRELLVAYIKVRTGEDAGTPDADAESAQPVVANKFLSVHEDGDWAVVLFRQPIDPNSVLEIGGQRIRSRESGELFRKIDGKWYLASGIEQMQEMLEMLEVEDIKIEESQIPYKKPLDIGDIRANYFELAGAEEGKNKIAFWGDPTNHLGEVNVGEKPFTNLPRKNIRLDSFGMWMGSSTSVDDSYIRRGERTIHPGLSRIETVFFVPPYKLTITSVSGQGLMLEIVEATKDELLFGEARRAHYLELLESPSAEERYNAMVGLLEMLNSFNINVSRFIGDLTEICDNIRALAKDEDEKVADRAIHTLRAFGDEQALLEMMDDPLHLHEDPLHSGETIARWNLRQRSEAVNAKALSFLDSENKNKHLLAIGYFLGGPGTVSDRENEAIGQAIRQAILVARTHESPEVRLMVVGRLRFFFDAEAPPLIAEMLQDTDERVIIEALHQVNRVNRFIDTSIVIPFLQHPNERIRSAAVYALRGKRDLETIHVLLEASSDQSRSVRISVANALGINVIDEAKEDVINRLAEMIREDPEEQVRQNAVFGLRRIDDPRVLPILREALIGEQNDWVRNTIQESIDRSE